MLIFPLKTTEKSTSNLLVVISEPFTITIVYVFTCLPRETVADNGNPVTIGSITG